MKLELIQRVLDGVHGARKDGAAHLFTEDTEVTLYIGLSAEVLTVPRISKVIAEAELLSLETHKGDRLFFSPQDVVGVKVGAVERPGASRGAGFR